MYRKYSCLKKNKYFFEKYNLEVIQDKDIETIRRWRNNKLEVLRQNSKISKKAQIKYYKNNIWNELKKKHPINMLFTFNLNNSIIGYGGIVNISWQNKRGEISFLLDDKINENSKLYQIYFEKFLKLIKLIAFKEIKIKKIYTETYSFRKKHIKILSSFGFKKEGYLISQYYNANKFYNSYIHSLINSTI